MKNDDPSSEAEPRFRDPKLTTAQVAAMLGITPHTLRVRRCRGNPSPPWQTGDGGDVYYLRSEVERWILSMAHGQSSGGRHPRKARGLMLALRRMTDMTRTEEVVR